MTVANENPQSSRFTLVAWTLFASVVLNLFLAGAFLGLAPHADAKPQHKPFGPMLMAAAHGEYLVDWMAHFLEPKDADAFREAFKSQEDALKEAHAHVHQATSDLAAVFEQNPPDPTALQATLDELTKAKGEVNAAVGKVLQSAYAKLSPEGRKRIADLAQNPT